MRVSIWTTSLSQLLWCSQCLCGESWSITSKVKLSRWHIQGWIFTQSMWTHAIQSLFQRIGWMLEKSSINTFWLRECLMPPYWEWRCWWLEEQNWLPLWFPCTHHSNLILILFYSVHTKSLQYIFNICKLRLGLIIDCWRAIAISGDIETINCDKDTNAQYTMTHQQQTYIIINSHCLIYHRISHDMITFNSRGWLIPIELCVEMQKQWSCSFMAQILNEYHNPKKTNLDPETGKLT